MPPEKKPTQPGELQQVLASLKSANNVLVTISSNPSVDQFAACIGLTLVLNKLNKHANAVFSGAIPSTIDFLKPEDTIEKNTDSLRDFIIALDKSKADKLRYKVENDVVKIFITPYRTNISQADLNFSHGDFNVDAVVALGVKDKSHLDAAILAHGRILHDAAVISVNNGGESTLGSINWTDAQVSSLCEMVADVAKELSGDVFDKQNATALLTGIVAETERYSNEKASPHTMAVAGLLMSAGASTQLVSTKLEAPKEQPLPKVEKPPLENAKSEQEDDGVIEIDHSVSEDDKPIDHKAPQDDKPASPKEPADSEEDKNYDPANQIIIDEHGSIKKIEDLKEAGEDSKPEPAERSQPKPASRMINQPPSLGGRLTANDRPEEYYSNADPLSQPSSDSDFPPVPPTPKVSPARPSGQSAVPKKDKTEDSKKLTLSDIEKSIGSPHAEEVSDGSVPELELDETRKAVDKAAGLAEPPQVPDDPAKLLDDQDSQPPKFPPPPTLPPQ
ncbi:hypothetical protein KY385_03795 [Candidatus Parcubacteria bacterium]|nr:hypothetical protein [Candidatus Parcubacteria bacterium]